MAGVEKTTQVVETNTYTITLDQEEAEALKAVLAKVGGHRNLSRRGLVQGIFDALDEANVRYDISDMEHGSSIRFVDRRNF